MQEWLNWHAWKACEPLKGSAGSNPALSATGIKPRESEVFLFSPNAHTAGVKVFVENKKTLSEMKKVFAGLASPPGITVR